MVPHLERDWSTYKYIWIRLFHHTHTYTHPHTHTNTHTHTTNTYITGDSLVEWEGKKLAMSNKPMAGPSHLTPWQCWPSVWLFVQRWGCPNVAEEGRRMGERAHSSAAPYGWGEVLQLSLFELELGVLVLLIKISKSLDILHPVNQCRYIRAIIKNIWGNEGTVILTVLFVSVVVFGQLEEVADLKKNLHSVYHKCKMFFWMISSWLQHSW